MLDSGESNKNSNQVVEKPVPPYQITEETNRGVKVKKARGTIKNTTFSVIPDGLNGLEIAFLRKNSKNEEVLVSEPIGITATPPDLEEIAEMLARYLKVGAKPEEIMEMLKEMNMLDSEEMHRIWTEKYKDKDK